MADRVSSADAVDTVDTVGTVRKPGRGPRAHTHERQTHNAEVVDEASVEDGEHGHEHQPAVNGDLDRAVRVVLEVRQTDADRAHCRANGRPRPYDGQGQRNARERAGEGKGTRHGQGPEHRRRATKTRTRTHRAKGQLIKLPPAVEAVEEHVRRRQRRAKDHEEDAHIVPGHHVAEHLW